MSSKQYFFHIRKEALKFAAAHMTVFPDGTKETLHGHNYTTEVSLEVSGVDFEKTIPFSSVKKVLREICEAWDEKVLLQVKCPHFQMKRRDVAEVEFELCQKRYVLPSEDVVLLDLDNITSESLAEEFCQRVVHHLKTWPEMKWIESISVQIEESPGQGGKCIWRKGK